MFLSHTNPSGSVGDFPFYHRKALAPPSPARSHNCEHQRGWKSLGKAFARQKNTSGKREKLRGWENGNFRGYYLGCTIIARRAWRRKKSFSISFSTLVLVWPELISTFSPKKNFLWLKLFPRVVLFLAFNTFMTHELRWTEWKFVMKIVLSDGERLEQEKCSESWNFEHSDAWSRFQTFIASKNFSLRELFCLASSSNLQER